MFHPRIFSRWSRQINEHNVHPSEPIAEDSLNLSNSGIMTVGSGLTVCPTQHLRQPLIIGLLFDRDGRGDAGSGKLVFMVMDDAGKL